MSDIIILLALFMVIIPVLSIYTYQYISYRNNLKQRASSQDSKSNNLSETLTLKKITANSSKSKKETIMTIIVLVFMFGSIFMTFVVAPVIDAPESERSVIVEKILDKFRHGISQNPLRQFMLIIGLLMIPFAFILPRYIRDEKIILDKQGITYFSPLPDFLKSLQPDWKIDWKNIEQLTLGTALHKGVLFIKEAGKTNKRRLIPAEWKLENDITYQANVFAHAKLNRRIMHNPDFSMKSIIIRYIQEYTTIEVHQTKSKFDNSILLTDLTQKKVNSFLVVIIFTAIFSALAVYILIE